MTNLRNFFNSVSGNNRIFTSEDIGEMSKEEFANSEKAILFRLCNQRLLRSFRYTSLTTAVI